MNCVAWASQSSEYKKVKSYMAGIRSVITGSTIEMLHNNGNCTRRKEKQMT